ncbi:MAG TPA: ATP-binding protein, partial [Cryptosporangiaceae bacterium]|nr:ATP-binding protein [Cryptosporangiaceae bacterium]
MAGLRGTPWRGWSLRTRLVLLGTVGLALGLAVGGLVLVAALRFTLERTVDASATQTARDVAALVDADQLPNPVPAGGTTVVQVVDAQGRVRAASAGGDRLVAVLDSDERAALAAGQRWYLPGHRFGVNGLVRVVAVPAGPAEDRVTVVVAAPAGDIDHTVRVVRVALFAGFALLLAVLAFAGWRIVGATLRPVEALRRGAEVITGGRSTGQLPVPASQDEIHRLAVTLNDMLGRLEAARLRQRAFVADAAHELRSPVASLRTQLEVAAATGTDGAPLPAELLPDLLTDVERLGRLVDDLLLLARVEGPVPERRRVEVDLEALASGAVSRYATARVPVILGQNPLAEGGAAVGTAAEGTTAEGRLSADRMAERRTAAVGVSGDPDALARVLANLLDNAVRYATSEVVVEVAPDGFTVRDDGPGIAPADRGRVFDRFTRLDDARDRDSGGAGLGLAIVAELLAQHG